ncbi:MAG: hypothetical protein RLZZ299_2991 [Pseudomonadota bacterium]|jgi:ABC-type lipoprotein release transport system permease subunit
MIARLALRNVWRNTRRSLLTALMVTLGVALLTIAMAWIEGVLGGALDRVAQSSGTVRVAHPDFVRREAALPLDANLPVTDALAARLGTVPGVTSVVPRIRMPVTVATGGELGERFGLLQGAPSGYYADVMGLPGSLVAGRMPASREELLIGRELAAQLRAEVGAEVVVLGQTQDGSLAPGRFTLAGIVDLGGGMQDRQLFADLGAVRWLADIPEGATEILVFGASREDASQLAVRVRAALPAGEGPAPEVQAWDARPPFDQLLVFASAVHGVGAAVIVFITALGVFNTMLMSVLERTAEFGVLRALGIRRPQIVGLVLIEAGVIALVGGVLGALLGSAGAWWLQVHGVHLGEGVKRLDSPVPVSELAHARLTPEIVGMSVLLGLAMALVGGLLPALRASRIAPVEAMRART